MEQYVSVRVDRVGPVAQLTLVGPGKWNAMGHDIWRELPRVFQDLDAGPGARAVVLRELALTGKDIDAIRAERIGLVNDVYPDGRAALAAAHELARQIADNPPLVVRGVKEILELDRAPRVEAGLRCVSAWNAAFMPSEDLAEAVCDFSERRPSQFTGR